MSGSATRCSSHWPHPRNLTAVTQVLLNRADLPLWRTVGGVALAQQQNPQGEGEEGGGEER